MTARATNDPLAPFHEAVRAWFAASFDAPTPPQAQGWPAIARGDSTLILAPTGSGKTLAAFLWCINRVMFAPAPSSAERCRILYVSPLKALAVDVERNLRAPLTGISAFADRLGASYVVPTVAIRTGDTPQAERARFLKTAADILITTPESLYLLLTSNARQMLRSVETIIIDEIHALVPTKRGAHMSVSLERLESLCATPPQRIGLSATQRPLDEVARFLGGAEPRARGTRTRSRRAATAELDAESEIAEEFTSNEGPVRYRPVTVVDAGRKKALKLTIDVPVEDMANLASTVRGPAGRKKRLPGGGGAAAAIDALDGTASAANGGTIWSAIHPRLLELIREHRSTLIFVNSRRLAERLAGALNELAGDTLVRSHHGSIARAQRMEIEDLLKAGSLRALVATSSLELGIDMGAIDLVIQIEAPPSVASGLQRIGRGGHRADAVSEGVIVPKFRGDLVACAAVARAMHEGMVESTRYPRNPLDIVAQQIVAMTSVDEWQIDDLFATIRSAAPFAELSRIVFDGVLDMLSGRYPSDEFAELRPRITWDRIRGTIVAREGAKRVAIANGGTIPDRGLYGVFLAGAAPGTARVGELDEEMVFESRVGETFVLGASSWRIEEITHDRVLVTPAAGQPGKMPFWKGDRAGRPLELGLAIGELTQQMIKLPPQAAVERLMQEHDLSERAAGNLLQYLRDQQRATRVVPDASTIVVERVRDELGDWRVCVLSPRGGRIHAPWAMAAAAKIREETGIDAEILWGDDGFVVRFPDVDEPPDVRLVMPEPDEVQPLVVRQLGATALFAAKFRENAARALLLPKRRPGMRAPLWQQRKRAADLLAVASRFGSFPISLETYRECLRDFFDMTSLVATLRDVRSRKIRVATVDAETPSPFAASLLFTYVASFIYEGDAPLAERRAQALAVDQSQLRELLGDAELRELLDLDAFDALELELQRREPRWRAKSIDGIHDLLLAVGDLTEEEVRERAALDDAPSALAALSDARRAIAVRIGGESRWIAVEDAARMRDALGVPLPVGLPESLLAPVRDPLGGIAQRYARTHAPFTAAVFAARYGLSPAEAESLLVRLTAEGRLVEGEFRPGGTRREWTDAEVLRKLRRRSLAKLREEVEPVDQAALGRFATTWQGIVRRRHGADALLDAIEQLQGAPLPASILETEILPSRLDLYEPADLDAVTAAGEVVWVGVEPLGERDGRIALYLADQLPALLPPTIGTEGSTARDNDAGGKGRENDILEHLAKHGASFFGPLHEAVGGGYPAQTVDALWNLVWQGLITNDTFHALRAFAHVRAPRRSPQRRMHAAPFRSRRLVPSSAEGRWSLVPRPHSSSGGATNKAQRRSGSADVKAHTRWAAALTQQLLTRHGVVTREIVSAENVAGGFATVYPVLRGLEDAGRIRRGYFVAGLGAAQFALPGAVDLLRSLRDGSPGHAPSDDTSEVAVLAATDPANPYGAALKWPERHDTDGKTIEAGRAPTRTVGATVILVDGALGAYLARGDRQLATFLPASEPERSRVAKAVAGALIERARSGTDGPRGMLIEEIDGAPPQHHPMARFLARAGFVAGALGIQATFHRAAPIAQVPTPSSAPDARPRPRPGRSTVSSPFARRYFDSDSTDPDDADDA
ncbi:MAG TPA: DEAD/DEAH box helicase [Vicinamibacterales bacterium]